MMPSKHVIASTATGVIFLALTKSWAGTIACFLGGILIDVDHWMDYCFINKRICRSFNDLRNFCLDKTGKIYLVFHSYELMVVLWVLAIYLKMSVLWLGILYGMSVHLLLDQLTNTIHPLAYFWFYRSKIGFPKSIFFHEPLIKNLGHVHQ